MFRFFLMLPALFPLLLFAQSGDRYEYINRYKQIAIAEMERTGVPASIKLAQGILESNAGKSYLAQKANNHFGIKCGDNWKGKKVWRKDDDLDKHGRLRKSCFRAYKSAEECYVAHSEFLRDPKKRNRYGFLFELDPYDYKAWAKGLKKAGYATSKTYSQKLIKVIEDYELYQYDRMSSSDIFAGNTRPKSKRWKTTTPQIEGLDIRNFNDANLVLTSEGQTPREIAEKVDLKVKCLLKYNEKLEDPDRPLPAETRIYIQPKRNGFRGVKKWHYIKAGETMYEISQIYGVKLSKLYKRNRLPEGAEPAVGERIKLRGFKIRKNEVPHTRYVQPSDGPVLKDDKTEEDPFMDDSETITPDKPTEETTPVTEPAEEEIELEPLPPIIEPITPETTPDETITPEPPAEVFHIVQKGDTLYSISKRYGTTVDQLRKLNGLTSNIIHSGQKLRVK
ncbi:MAG: LysM peptidoglycan-binding domain-containing protein [Bacteroidetes bacterium]|nr:MAG: LysM peptidoglycan-binding domain-containing protein [Bacteroidota bacterium]